METLYVSNGCPHCRKARAFLARAPTTVQKQIRVFDIDYKNAPVSVTHVPTIMTASGKTLVGQQVFDYLKQKRQDPKFPQTPEMSELGEMFHGMMSKRNWCLLIAIIIIVLFCCYHYKKPTPIPGLATTTVFSQFLDA